MFVLYIKHVYTKTLKKLRIAAAAAHTQTYSLALFFFSSLVFRFCLYCSSSSSSTTTANTHGPPPPHCLSLSFSLDGKSIIQNRHTVSQPSCYMCASIHAKFSPAWLHTQHTPKRRVYFSLSLSLLM